ncbi:MAG: HD domain-containing protein [Anaerolineales bacterium]|nr:HD domain-containing protein [Anaerolineales bacterium]
MTTPASSPLETKTVDSFSTRFWLELFSNSAHFPIANIMLEFIVEQPLAYLRAPDMYAIIAASLAQSYWLTRWQTSSHPRRFLGNLIGPALYTVFEGLIEGPRFFSASHHVAYWVFAFAIGLLQGVRMRAPTGLRNLITMVENVFRTAIIFFMYIISETYLNVAQTSSIRIFLSDESHKFIGLTILFLGLSLSLANLTAERYQRLLAEETKQHNEKRLRELIEVAPFSAHLYELNAENGLIFAGANDSANTMLGIDSQQLIGKTIEEAFPQLAKTDIPLIYRQVAVDGIMHHSEQVIRKKDGTEGIYDVHVIQTGPNRMVAFFHDITELTHAYDMTLEGWSRAMDLRDNETEGHTQRVTTMAVELASVMDISQADILHIRRGALLHDIGKMGVPDHILFKSDKLTSEDWILMRKHPELAYEMLAPITFLRPALNIPYCHHEKWDGTGYPRGLKGEEIPLAARIFSVADVWDALYYGRRYREGWSEKQVLDYIQEQSGKHFDPQVVEAFLKLRRLSKNET